MSEMKAKYKEFIELVSNEIKHLKVLSGWF